MTVSDIANYIRGYVVIRGEGRFPERFLNICTHRKMNIWDVHYCGDKIITAKMSREAFAGCRDICRRTGMRVRITLKRGLPFVLRRYRKRKPIVLGVVAVALLLWYSSGHIMGITVFGNNKISTETILDGLAVSDIAIGKSTSGIDSAKVRNRMMIDLPDLAWLGITINGSRVYVEVVERTEEAEILDTKTPCNLVAIKDGVIESIEARNGQTMIKKGSGVREGDVLVSGIMESETAGIRYVHSYGEVFAQTTYKASKEYSLRFEEPINSGENKKRYSIQIFGKEIPLYIGKKQPYEKYEVVQQEWEFKAPFDLAPSLFFKKETYNEQKIISKKRTVAQILEEAKKELKEELEKEISAETEIKDVALENTLTENGDVLVTLTYTCRENIARKAVIDGAETEENTEAETEEDTGEETEE